MNAYNVGQEYNNLRWGTMMPIALSVGSQFVQVRARGTCSVMVQDVERFQQQVSNPAEAAVYVQSLMAVALSDMFGERSAAVSDIKELTTINEATVQALRSRFEPKCNEVGLQLKALSIDAIETI